MELNEKTQRIVVTRAIPHPGPELLLKSGVQVEVLQTDEEQGVEHSRLVEAATRADVLLTLLTEKVDHEVLSANPRLRGVANMAVGFNNIDVASATDLGIPVTNTPGVLTETTADFVWAMILAVARRVPQAHNYMVAGKYNVWGPGLFLGGDVGLGPTGRKKVLGVVGYGRIGAAVARRSIGFDMEVLVHSPRGVPPGTKGVEATDLDTLLQRSDFVTLHTPLNSETHHLIGEAQLRQMKPTAYLINSARGPVVDESALVKALAESWIAGAALDVYEDEPNMAAGLAASPNAVLFPHIASASIDTRGRMAEIAVVNALGLLRGDKAPQCVNPAVFETASYAARQGS